MTQEAGSCGRVYLLTKRIATGVWEYHLSFLGRDSSFAVAKKRKSDDVTVSTLSRIQNYIHTDIIRTESKEIILHTFL